MNNNNSYVEISVFSLRRLWADFAMRGWTRSGFLLQCKAKVWIFALFLQIPFSEGNIFPSFTLQVVTESRFLAKTTP